MKKLFYTLPLLFIFSQLQGCVAGLFVATGTAIAVESDSRSVNQQIDDKELAMNAAEKVQQLKIHPDLIRINYIANDGHLLLIGQVNTQENKDAIDKQINTLTNIKGLYNQLQIGSPLGFSQQSKDTWITTKVKTMLAADEEIDPLKIKVITENGEVYLIGQISAEMADNATNITRKVEGVKKVNRIFQFTDK
ncbi:BON domain-containing protein [Psychromonas sp. MME2]|uniref:BON domain-containing protein n=1 Tax=unclassified Psychromonas TaxID=2614957 RepID=UPI00339CC90A